MKLSYAWLKEYLPKLPAPSALAERLMMHGLEVEAVADQTGVFKQIVVGEIKSIQPHPEADKLRLAGVLVAAGQPPLEIVCGAPNIEVGQKVPVALVGAKLPNGLTIERRKIRGIYSNGMICAADELGLGKNHTGIMVLDSALQVGTPFAKAVGLDDVVFDLAIPANRSDLFSVRGLAREIGAITGLRPKITMNKLQIANRKNKSTINIKVTDKKLCPIYTAQVIHGVKVQSSPMWLQNRLHLAGMRPINAIVDATNHIMLEYGQPLHAFDVAKIKGGITVRPAKTGETLVTLDEQHRSLDPSMLVIADEHQPVALAGVMGGANSEINNGTTDIILESAIFDPVSIRKTSWKLGLQSEASRRFEKGLPGTLPMEASHAAATLIVELCGGTVEEGMAVAGIANAEAVVIKMQPKFISDLLGISITAAKAKSLLTKLGFAVSGAATWKVTVPSWRLDVTTPEDIVDEIGRMIGYDTLPEQPSPGKVGEKNIPQVIRFKDEVRNILVDFGFSEIISHAFYGVKEAAGDQGDHFGIANPLDKTQHVLRKSLLPQIQEVLRHQADAGQDAMIFEIGRVFDPNLKGDIEQQQPWKIAFGITEKVTSQMISSIADKIADQLQADVQLETVLSDQIVRGRRLKYCEVDLAELMTKSKLNLGPWDPSRYTSRNLRYRPQSRFPAITRDVSAFTPDNLGYRKILENLINALDGQKQLLDLSKVKADWYKKDGKTSITFHLVFQSNERTLTKAEVDAIMDRLEKALTALGAIIR